MEKLKPCPLCAKSSVVTDTIGWLWYVTCLSCDCKSGEYENESEAVAAWNNRPGEDKLRASGIEAMRNAEELSQHVEALYSAIDGINHAVTPEQEIQAWHVAFAAIDKACVAVERK